MTKSYSIKWANGLAFGIFKLGSRVEIEGSAEDGYQKLSVHFVDTNLSPSPQKVDAFTRDGYTIEVELVDPSSSRAVMVEWQDQVSGTTMLIGEVFVGDPDGAGGFGGEQDSTEPEEDPA